MRFSSATDVDGAVGPPDHETTRSVPPYNFGGTLSARGATCAMRLFLFRAVSKPPGLSLDHEDNSTGVIWFMVESAIDHFDVPMSHGARKRAALSFCRVPLQWERPFSISVLSAMRRPCRFRTTSGCPFCA